jgi:hypothetical protein
MIHVAILEHNKNITRGFPTKLSQTAHRCLSYPNPQKGQAAKILYNSPRTCPLAVGFHSGHVAKGKVAGGLWPH